MPPMIQTQTKTLMQVIRKLIICGVLLAGSLPGCNDKNGTDLKAFFENNVHGNETLSPQQCSALLRLIDPEPSLNKKILPDDLEFATSPIFVESLVKLRPEGDRLVNQEFARIRQTACMFFLRQLRGEQSAPPVLDDSARITITKLLVQICSDIDAAELRGASASESGNWNVFDETGKLVAMPLIMQISNVLTTNMSARDDTLVDLWRWLIDSGQFASGVEVHAFLQDSGIPASHIASALEKRPGLIYWPHPPAEFPDK